MSLVVDVVVRGIIKVSASQSHDGDYAPDPVEQNVLPGVQGKAVDHGYRERKQSHPHEQERETLREIRSQVRVPENFREHIRHGKREKVKSPLFHASQVQECAPDESQHDDKCHGLVAHKTHEHEGQTENKYQ